MRINEIKFIHINYCVLFYPWIEEKRSPSKSTFDWNFHRENLVEKFCRKNWNYYPTWSWSPGTWDPNFHRKNLLESSVEKIEITILLNYGRLVLQVQIFEKFSILNILTGKHPTWSWSPGTFSQFQRKFQPPISNPNLSK